MRPGMIRGIVCALLVSAPALGQTRQVFEVASIRPSSEQATQVNVGMHISGAQVRMTYMSLRDYVAIAYRVRVGQVVGPDWLAQQRFDIAAKIPDGVSSDAVAGMLQTLLADRFQLAVHRDMKEFSVYALGVGKGGPKLKESADAGDAPGDRPANVNVAASGSVAGVFVDLGAGSFFNLANNRLEIHKMTAEALASMLTRFLDRPVVDTTALKGSYDLTLDLTPEDYTALLIRSAVNAGVVLPPQALRALDALPGDPLSGPLQTFGLTLDARKAPLDVIVVDTMQKTPTEN
jgi:uncharacterized protein (TIGR03435 family)